MKSVASPTVGPCGCDHTVIEELDVRTNGEYPQGESIKRLRSIK